MSAAWRIFAARNLLYVQYGGVVDASILADSFTDILKEPAWSPGLDRVFDLSAIDRFDASGFTADAISARWRKALAENPERSGKVVIVAADDLTFAMHRMYSVFRALPEEKFTVVRSLDEACDFLDLERGSLFANN